VSICHVFDYIRRHHWSNGGGQMLESSDLVAMTAAKKADLFEAAARRMTEGRYDATIALASLQRSNGYLDLGCKTVEELAWKGGKLPYPGVIDMLRVGRKLLEIRELDLAFKDGRLCWSKVRALVPLITPANAAEWIWGGRGRPLNPPRAR